MMVTKKKSNKAKKELHSYSWYRDRNQKIPSEVYADHWKNGRRTQTIHYADGSTKVVKKYTLAPLGRPPSDPSRGNTYNPLRKQITPYGQTMIAKGLGGRYKDIQSYTIVKPVSRSKSVAKPVKKSKQPKKVSKRTFDRYSYNDDYAKYLRAMDSYEDEMAEEQLVYSDSRSVYADLEDKGYSDTRKTWRKTGKRTQLKARNKLAYREFKDRNYYM